MVVGEGDGYTNKYIQQPSTLTSVIEIGLTVKPKILELFELVTVILPEEPKLVTSVSTKNSGPTAQLETTVYVDVGFVHVAHETVISNGLIVALL